MDHRVISEIDLNKGTEKFLQAVAVCLFLVVPMQPILPVVWLEATRLSSVMTSLEMEMPCLRSRAVPLQHASAWASGRRAPSVSLTPGTASGWSCGFDNVGGNGLLTATYIPEPTSFALLAFSGLLAFRRRRK